MSKKVSVNILTWNAGKYIGPCLKSIFAQAYNDIEINIYDNGSEDDTVTRVQKIIQKSGKEINFWQGDKNIGFAAGHNRLIRKSSGEFVLLLNQDAVLKNDYIEKAVAEMDKDKKIAAIQPKILRYNHNKKEPLDSFDTTGLCMFRNRRVINRGQTETDKGQYDKKEEVFGADGAVPFIRREALEDVKLPKFSEDGQGRAEFEYFDEDFFAYKEDVDLAWRLRLYGWKAVYCPAVVAYHSRESGDSAADSWWKILKEGGKISIFSKKLAFKNQRLMQIKNELPKLFWHDIFQILKKEILTWGYILFFEPRVLGILPELVRKISSAKKKREMIMKKKRVDAGEIKKWFE